MNKILYAGDSSLSGAAAYLAGVMAHYGLRFDYVPSGRPLGPAVARKRHALYILSDYPASNLRPADCRIILDAVSGGAGLLMIGGWESYHGLGGDYDRSPLAAALPVRMLSRDDRVNTSQPVALVKTLDHAIVRGLPFDRPPCVGGYNRFGAKRGAKTLLIGRHVVLRAEERCAGATAATCAAVESGHGCKQRSRGTLRGAPQTITASAGRVAPMLVVGAYGLGRTAAFASDAAPHWVGGFVDWGPRRVSAQAKGAEAVEVGSLYAEFFGRLITWTMGKPTG